MSPFKTTISCLSGGITFFKRGLTTGFWWLGFTCRMAQKTKLKQLAVTNAFRGHAASLPYFGSTPNALPPNTRQTFDRRPILRLLIFQINDIFYNDRALTKRLYHYAYNSNEVPQ